VLQRELLQDEVMCCRAIHEGTPGGTLAVHGIWLESRTTLKTLLLTFVWLPNGKPSAKLVLPKFPALSHEVINNFLIIEGMT
jgi:hypothetical protein